MHSFALIVTDRQGRVVRDVPEARIFTCEEYGAEAQGIAAQRAYGYRRMGYTVQILVETLYADGHVKGYHL